jgi:hypothetical protein
MRLVRARANFQRGVDLHLSQRCQILAQFLFTPHNHVKDVLIFVDLPDLGTLD